MHGLFILASICGAAVAVPLFYEFRMSDPLFFAGVAGFIGVPMLLAIWKSYPSKMHLKVSVGLLLTCPVNYVVMDFWELGRDIFFLIAGTNILYTSMIRTIESFRSRQWTHFTIAVLGVIVAAGAIFVMIFLFLYLE